MTEEFMVGFRRDGKSEDVAVMAEDALVAALRVKHHFPQAMITYARKRNRRGDARHPPLERLLDSSGG